VKLTGAKESVGVELITRCADASRWSRAIFNALAPGRVLNALICKTTQTLHARV